MTESAKAVLHLFALFPVELPQMFSIVPSIAQITSNKREVIPSIQDRDLAPDCRRSVGIDQNLGFKQLNYFSRFTITTVQ